MDVVFDAAGLIAAMMMITVCLLVTVWYLATRYGPERYCLLLAVVCTIFQIGHLSEHGLQLGFWFSDPKSMPWMSPVAWINERGLAVIAGQPRNMMVGMELLHFMGNWIFLIGLAAWSSQFSNKWLTFALRLQMLHVLEHVILTVSALTYGSPIGLSTLFGYAVTLLGPEWAAAYRVWFHFTANLVATCAVFKALSVWRPALLQYKRFLPAVALPRR